MRSHSPERTLDEMEVITNDYPAFNWIFIYDDFFLFDKKRVLAICEEIHRRKIKVNWGCYSRIDSIKPEILPVLREAGCRMISFGVESGSDRVLKLMKKHQTRKQIEETITNVKAAGIAARSSIFFGHPGETVRDALKTIHMMWKLKLTYQELVMGFGTVVYPATGLDRELREKGILPPNFNWCDKFDIPHYKDCPTYRVHSDLLKELMARVYKKIFVTRRAGLGTPLWRSGLNLTLEMGDRLLKTPHQSMRDLGGEAAHLG